MIYNNSQSIDFVASRILLPRKGSASSSQCTAFIFECNEDLY